MVDPERRRAPRIELHINTILTTVATAGIIGVSGVLSANLQRSAASEGDLPADLFAEERGE